jgi:hypothetical protein
MSLSVRYEQSDQVEEEMMGRVCKSHCREAHTGLYKESKVKSRALPVTGRGGL